MNTPPPPGTDLVELAIGALAILFLLGILVLILYLLYDAQRAIPPEYRHVEPAQVWLLLIPLFNLVWNFFVYPQIADSYRSYFYSRGRFDVGDAGKSVGLWFSICSASSIIPCVGFIPALIGLILLIVFLIRIYGLKSQLPQLATMPVVRAARGAGRIPSDVRAAGAISTRAGCRAAATTAAARVMPVLPLWQPTQEPLRSLLPA